MRLAWSFAVLAAACSNSSTGTVDAPAGGHDGTTVDSPTMVDASIADLTVQARVGVLVLGTTTTEAIDPTTLVVVLDDGSKPTITMQDDGTIAFVRKSTTQSYQITTGSAADATIVESDAARLNYLPPLFGHTLLKPVTQNTPLSVNVASAGGSGGAAALLFATGQRASLAVPSPFFSGVVNWQTATPTNQHLGLLSSSAGDTLWFLHYTAPTPGHLLADQVFQADPIEQTDGVSSNVTGTASVLATQGCIRAVGPVTEELTRFGSGAPGATGIAATLGVASQLSASTVNIGEVTVANASVAADSSVDVPYTTPFPGEDLVGTFTITGTNKHAFGATKVPSTSSMTVHIALDDGAHGCLDTDKVTFGSGAAYATGISVNGVPISADDQKLPNPTGATVPIVVTAGSGPADRYTVQLFDSTVGAIVGTWVSGKPAISIPGALFVSGHTYNFDLKIDSGLAGAAHGDLTSITYPTSTTTTTSYTFTTSS
jgi:hypothetical protein